ncbi:LysR family transcriptional regulator [Agrobacterium vitis]|uniref:LysR family transcriptional regulator n=1 Tax=Agrobacterium vitis TaxID=373 RepID=A0A368NMR8_AGRVI|nr:LysR substrate-binding domain-containing protein [Agrobacterium vitis]KAA3507765.1 LysR family transcriptional regulator [Agrobacterium vitis]KAA3522258.1 LysR family transcriptional regulator [Agrobacterium vitis]MCF1478952.1 LysR family transcriptional regulator [Agrobacterium vitis]MUO80385.1 LysR family transcriptional regulator [Agrobacterium vitis]MUO94815.1 LysR family transcriptional regulator [Agrobacterium vitis]
MRRRVPLNSVRAFEAAARRMSLVQASDELCVTPTAVSHQIRQLEDFLQTKLFLRRSSRLELTPESRACLAKLTEALDIIDDAISALHKPVDMPERLVVGASASVGSLWLMPRLRNFYRTAPEIDISLTTFIERSTIETDTSDVWICNWHTNLDRRVELLLEEDIIPVCSPQMAEEFGELSFDSLRELPLVHVDRAKASINGQYPDWDRYLREYGISRNDIAKGPRFNQAGPAIEAAKAGMGALLGRSILIEHALETGELIRLGDPYPIRNPYYLISPLQPASKAVKTFKDWIFAEAKNRTSVFAELPHKNRRESNFCLNI